MKKFLLLLVTSPLLLNNGLPRTSLEPIMLESIREVVIEQPVIIPPKRIENLVNALIYVESRGIDSAIGDRHLKEPSVGVLQLRPVMVREVNRICKKKGLKERFTLKDRFDRNKSIHMFLIWKEFHHKNSNFETISRSWNGGPRGPKSNRTLKYWEKVEQQLNNN